VDERIGDKPDKSYRPGKSSKSNKVKEEALEVGLTFRALF
jgi:hypothetical protein